jgi:hypothetical protein
MTKMELNLLLFQPAITWLVVICIYIYIRCKNGTRPPRSHRTIPNVANTNVEHCRTWRE